MRNMRRHQVRKCDGDYTALRREACLYDMPVRSGAALWRPRLMPGRRGRAADPPSL